MVTIFIEYKIKTDSLEPYLKAIKEIPLKLPPGVNHYQLLEAVDQSALFVEVLQLPNEEHYHRWKQMVQNDDPALPWHCILMYIAGGKEKFNMWSFQPVDPSLKSHDL